MGWLDGRSKMKSVMLVEQDEQLVESFEQWLSGAQDLSPEFEELRGKFEALARLAREAIEHRQHDASGGGFPPRGLDDGGGGGGKRPTQLCGSCRWFIIDPGEPQGICTIDPPVVWKGENAYLFLRPEVKPHTPACYRREEG